MPLRACCIVLAAWLGLHASAQAGGTPTGLLTPIEAGGLRAELDALAGQVVLVNFWATWCRPCLDEIPALRDIERQLHDDGFRLVAVSLDDADGAESLVRPFMDKWFPGFKSYLSLERERDDIVSVIDDAWNEILPTSYLIAPDGQVAERIQGKVAAETFTEKIRTLLEQR